MKQMDIATATWSKYFRSEPIESKEDFMSRFKILTDSRERLSTLALFWNDSNNDERYHHFTFFLTVIGGEGECRWLIEFSSENIRHVHFKIQILSYVFLLLTNRRSVGK
jgi:hypothetical protein